jgi:hypothetical protein
VVVRSPLLKLTNPQSPFRLEVMGQSGYEQLITKGMTIENQGPLAIAVVKLPLFMPVLGEVNELIVEAGDAV